jgi:hypothetical protein
MYLIKFAVSAPFDQGCLCDTASEVVPESRVLTFVEPVIAGSKVVIMARSLPLVVILVGIKRCRGVHVAFKAYQISQTVNCELLRRPIQSATDLRCHGVLKNNVQATTMCLSDHCAPIVDGAEVMV